MPITQDIAEILPERYRAEKINQKPFIFLEGPVWDGERRILFFTDPLAQTIVSMDENREFSVIYSNSGYANGMCLNHRRNLVICEMKTGSVVEIDPESGKPAGTVSSGYNRLPFNATNDIICDASGGYYVTDPFFTYGPKMQDIEATYYLSPAGETLRAAWDSIKPNGLALSPDGKKLYVDDTGSTKVWSYDVLPSGILENGTVFCNVKPPENLVNLTPVQYFGESDGMKVDSRGNVYITTITGIQIFNAQGVYLGSISMPDAESAANCAFGGKNLTTLYITARTSLYAVELLIPGI